MSSTLKDCLVDFSRVNLAKKVAFSKLKTGFDSFDKALDGGISQGLTILGAVPGLGKSTFALQMAFNIAKAGTPVLIFSMEMSAHQLMAKAITRYVFEHNKLFTPPFTAATLMNREFVEDSYDDKERWEYIEKATEEFKDYCENIIVYERSEYNGNTQTIAKRVSEYIEENKKSNKDENKDEKKSITPLVVVDYLQILSPGDNTSSDKQIVDKSVSILAELAIEKEIPVVLISALNRASYEKKMTMTSFRESSAIEYSADTLLGMQFSDMGNKDNFDIDAAKKKSPRKIEIQILKQRYGITGDAVRFDYYAQYDCFIEQSTQKINSKAENKSKVAVTAKSTSSKPKHTVTTMPTNKIKPKADKSKIIKGTEEIDFDEIFSDIVSDVIMEVK